MVKSAAPTATSMCVRRPASCSRSSRSAPIAPPSAPASTSRSRTAPQLRSGSTDGLDRVPLGETDLLDPARGEVEQLVQLIAGERSSLGRRLHLDQPAVAGEHDVDVDL